MPRWQLPAAAVLATVTIVVPLTALPLAASALVAGAGESRSAALLAALLAAFAYAGLFVAAGPLVPARRLVGAGVRPDLGERRRLLGGGRGAVHGARLGVLRPRAWRPAIDVQLEAGSAAAAFVVLPAVAIAGWLVATWRYRRADID